MLETMTETAQLETMTDFPSLIQFSESAALKVKDMIVEEGNSKLNLRVYVTGGGCSGFQYGFAFDEKQNDDDTIISKQKIGVIVDAMSLQYLIGSTIDYVNSLQGSHFVVSNPNANTTCGCGSSFSVN